MEETLQQEKEDLEYKNTDEDQGGIRRRLRDRDLLRKRKAEAEEKQTNQLESQRKRPRADEKSGSKKRGRPRKTEPTAEISVIQEEAAVPQAAPAVVVVPEPAGVIPDQIPGSFTPLLAVGDDTVETQAASAPMPVFGSVESRVFASALTPPAPDNSSAAALDQAPVQAAAPAPPLVETLYTEPQDREPFDQVLIEDLGPDEEENVYSSQDKDDEDLSDTLQISVPEQNKMFSIPTLSSPPPPQEYLPGN